MTYSPSQLWDLTDLELIDYWRSLPAAWSPLKRRAHDMLARRIQAKGRILHGGHVYRPTDDDSFESELVAQNIPAGSGKYTVGRQAELQGSRGKRVIRAVGTNPESEWW